MIVFSRARRSQDSEGHRGHHDSWTGKGLFRHGRLDANAHGRVPVLSGPVPRWQLNTDRWWSIAISGAAAGAPKPECGGRYWDRTSDLCRVKAALSR